ncbi:MAG: hypothetical protein V5A85_08305 [Haloarculaceae archaeon]
MISTPVPPPSAPEWTCSECDSGLANCQGLLACTDCEWVERP